MDNQISAAEKAAMQLHMETTRWVWDLLEEHFSGEWANAMSGDPDTIRTWARSLYKYGRADMLTAANLLIDQWMEKELPTLPAFRKFAEMALRRREADERNVNTPVGAAHKAKRKEFMRKYIELCKQIADSPTGREPSDEDVEHFDESYAKLGLEARYTGGIERVE